MPVDSLTLLSKLGSDTPRRWRCRFEHRVVFIHAENGYRRTCTVDAYHGQEALELALESLAERYNVAEFELVSIDRVRAIGGGSWL